jgi:hypothetical protein
MPALFFSVTHNIVKALVAVGRFGQLYIILHEKFVLEKTSLLLVAPTTR